MVPEETTEIDSSLLFGVLKSGEEVGGPEND